MESTTADEDEESSETLLVGSLIGVVEEDNDGGEGDVTEEGEDIPEVQVRLVTIVEESHCTKNSWIMEHSPSTLSHELQETKEREANDNYHSHW